MPEHVGTPHGLRRLARTRLHLQRACRLLRHLMRGLLRHLMRGMGRLQLGGVPSTLAHRLRLLTTTRLLELLGKRLHRLTTTRLVELLGERLSLRVRDGDL